MSPWPAGTEMIMERKPDYFDEGSKKRGLAHLVAATQYSLGGLRRALHESAFRQELAAAIILLAVYAWAGAALQHYAISLCLIFITLAVEALNTAIELVIDRTSPEISDYGRNAKDLGSFAVMCLLIANGIYAAWALWSTLAA